MKGTSPLLQDLSCLLGQMRGCILKTNWYREEVKCVVSRNQCQGGEKERKDSLVGEVPIHTPQSTAGGRPGQSCPPLCLHSEPSSACSLTVPGLVTTSEEISDAQADDTPRFLGCNQDFGLLRAWEPEGLGRVDRPPASEQALSFPPRFGSTIESWRPEMVPPSHDNLQGAWR